MDCRQNDLHSNPWYGKLGNLYCYVAFGKPFYTALPVYPAVKLVPDTWDNDRICMQISHSAIMIAIVAVCSHELGLKVNEQEKENVLHPTQSSIYTAVSGVNRNRKQVKMSKTCKLPLTHPPDGILPERRNIQMK